MTLLLDTSGNKVLSDYRGMIPNSHLFGRARIRGDTLDDDVLCSEYDFEVTIDTVYKMDPLWVRNAPHSN